MRRGWPMRLTDVGLAAARRVVAVPAVPTIPAGRTLELPGRGRTFVTDTGGDGPVLFLLHALACTGLLTWYPCLDELGRRYRVVLFDQRWHGQGIRSPRFALEDCADDVAAVADALQVDRFVCAGYSLGSLVAQLTWRRHRDRVAGLVLGASTTHFADTPARRRRVEVVGARIAAVAAAQQRFAAPLLVDPALDDRWAWRQFRATSPRAITSAASVIAGFDSRAWVGEIDVPAAVVVTTRDRLIPPARQVELARCIPDAATYEVAAGHAACVLSADQFRPAMLAAAASVTSRVEERSPTGRR